MKSFGRKFIFERFSHGLRTANPTNPNHPMLIDDGAVQLKKGIILGVAVAHRASSRSLSVRDRVPLRCKVWGQWQWPSRCLRRRQLHHSDRGARISRAAAGDFFAFWCTIAVQPPLRHPDSRKSPFFSVKRSFASFSGPDHPQIVVSCGNFLPLRRSQASFGSPYRLARLDSRPPLRLTLFPQSQGGR